MRAKHTPLQMVLVEPICDACGDGTYVAHGMDLSGPTPKFHHKCTNCGDSKMFLNKYPATGHTPSGASNIVLLTAEQQAML